MCGQTIATCKSTSHNNRTRISGVIWENSRMGGGGETVCGKIKNL